MMLLKLVQLKVILKNVSECLLCLGNLIIGGKMSFDIVYENELIKVFYYCFDRVVIVWNS